MGESLTIAAMIAELGPPANYAEQVLIGRMRAYAVAEAASASNAGRYGEWLKALVTKHAIEAFREYGDTPVLEVRS